MSIQEVIELIVNMHALAEYGPETTVEDLRWVGTMEGEHFRVKARARLASCSSITLTFMLGNVAELVDGELPSGR